jgi:DNA-binding IclR family transcriptional regulator
MSDKDQKLDAVGKIASVMELLCSSEETFSLREIQDRTGIPRSTLHRLLLSLEREEWVYRDDQSEQFRPGIRFFLLHNSNLFHQELIQAAAAEMERLVEETGKTAIMSVLEGSLGLCIHNVEPSRAVKYVAHRGMTVPAYAGATGKVLLAFCREKIRNHILSCEIPENLDRDKLLDQLEEIRRQGYAYSREEWMEHAGDISVPVFDSRGTFVAQLGLAGLVTSFEGQEETLVGKLKKAAEKIGRSL